jgi:hypothetical protein
MTYIFIKDRIVQTRHSSNANQCPDQAEASVYYRAFEQSDFMITDI